MKLYYDGLQNLASYHYCDYTVSYRQSCVLITALYCRVSSIGVYECID